LATAGSIITNVKRAYGDPDGDYITDTIGMEFLDIAQQRFCDEVEPLDEIMDYALTARQVRYDLPSNCIEPVDVMWFKNVTRKLQFEQYQQFDVLTTATPNSIGNSTRYTVFLRQLTLGPEAPNQTSATTLASGAALITATTIGLVAASGTFRSRGFLKNVTSGEVIEYTAIATTTVTGCTRGVHGTAAASVASNDQFQEIDVQMRYRKIPAAITATTSSPEIAPVYHRYLEQYMLYLAWRNRGDQNKAEIVYNEFEESEKRAKQKVSRRALEAVRMKDRRANGYWQMGY
jgi:hypothetical protein